MVLPLKIEAKLEALRRKNPEAGQKIAEEMHKMDEMAETCRFRELGMHAIRLGRLLNKYNLSTEDVAYAEEPTEWPEIRQIGEMEGVVRVLDYMPDKNEMLVIALKPVPQPVFFNWLEKKLRRCEVG